MTYSWLDVSTDRILLNGKPMKPAALCLTLVDEREDEGENHYYFVVKAMRKDDRFCPSMNQERNHVVQNGDALLLDTNRLSSTKHYGCFS